MMDGIPDIAPFKEKLEKLDEQIAAPDFFADQRRAARVSREQQKLTALVEQYEELEKLEQERSDSQALLEAPDTDEEMKELAQEELVTIEERVTELRQQVLISMIPPDESDSRNTVVEVRAGAGGDEASLFAGDLFRLYGRFAEERGWRIEPLGVHPSECGGFKEISFLVSGEEVYKTLKFESGVHRVQRVPTTETNGRIHTSTATVAVLPEAEEVDVAINQNDLEISVCRASGPGGQGVNTTDSAVQILHKPTGIIVTCADERSQLKNKNKAMTVLRSRLLKDEQEKEQAKYAATRRNQIGSGDRSERIRTYNFPQSRLTDHRIGYSAHNLPEIMDGKLDDLITALQNADYENRIQDLMEGVGV